MRKFSTALIFMFIPLFIAIISMGSIGAVIDFDGSITKQKSVLDASFDATKNLDETSLLFASDPEIEGDELISIIENLKGVQGYTPYYCSIAGLQKYIIVSDYIFDEKYLHLLSGAFPKTPVVGENVEVLANMFYSTAQIGDTFSIELHNKNDNRTEKINFVVSGLVNLTRHPIFTASHLIPDFSNFTSIELLPYKDNAVFVTFDSIESKNIARQELTPFGALINTVTYGDSAPIEFEEYLAGINRRFLLTDTIIACVCLFVILVGALLFAVLISYDSSWTLKQIVFLMVAPLILLMILTSLIVVAIFAKGYGLETMIVANQIGAGIIALITKLFVFAMLRHRIMLKKSATTVSED